MNEFLDLIESIRADEATVDRIFRGDGQSVRSGGRRRDPTYLPRLTALAEIYADAVTGGSRKAVYLLQEAMGTSDFPLLFGDIIDRQMLAGYREWQPTWPNYVDRRTVRDFRTVKDFTLDGGEGALAEVPQLTEYPEASLTEGKYEWSVKKYGRGMPFSWESFINDDLDSLADIPRRFARAARRTEERTATALFVDANGPHASLYTAGNKNIVNVANGASANNPALSISGLQDAFIVLSKQVDADGEPIAIDMVELVVPPALQITAQNILNAIQMEVVEAGGTANQKLIAVNWMKNALRLSANPYIPLIASTANGNRSWFLFARPSQSRPALRLGFLRGHEEPEIWIKKPDAQRVGGGEVGPFEGDFDTDSIRYRVRHVLGGTRLDGKATVASNGSGV